MGKFRIIVSDKIDNEILAYHDVIVNFSNPSMCKSTGISNIIYKKAGENILEKYIKNKYELKLNKTDNYMNIGTIRITPGFNLGMDIMFVRVPINEDESSKNQLFKIYENILNVLYKNEYKDILIPSLELFDLGFTDKEIGVNIYKIIYNFLKNKDMNIDLIISNNKNKKYYK